MDHTLKLIGISPAKWVLYSHLTLTTLRHFFSNCTQDSRRNRSKSRTKSVPTNPLITPWNAATIQFVRLRYWTPKIMTTTLHDNLSLVFIIRSQRTNPESPCLVHLRKNHHTLSKTLLGVSATREFGLKDSPWLEGAQRLEVQPTRWRSRLLAFSTRQQKLS